MLILIKFAITGHLNLRERGKVEECALVFVLLQLTSLCCLHPMTIPFALLNEEDVLSSTDFLSL